MTTLIPLLLNETRSAQDSVLSLYSGSAMMFDQQMCSSIWTLVFQQRQLYLVKVIFPINENEWTFFHRNMNVFTGILCHWIISWYFDNIMEVILLPYFHVCSWQSSFKGSRFWRWWAPDNASQSGRTEQFLFTCFVQFIINWSREMKENNIFFVSLWWQNFQ